MPRPYVRHKPKIEHLLPAATVKLIRKMLSDGERPTRIVRALRVGRMTVWRIQKKMEQENA